MSYWKTKNIHPAGEQARQPSTLPLALVVGRDVDVQPERPHRFRIVDEYGLEREVFAPSDRRQW